MSEVRSVSLRLFSNIPAISQREHHKLPEVRSLTSDFHHNDVGMFPKYTLMYYMDTEYDTHLQCQTCIQDLTCLPSDCSLPTLIIIFLEPTSSLNLTTVVFYKHNERALVQSRLNAKCFRSIIDAYISYRNPNRQIKYTVNNLLISREQSMLY